jgi:mono/diheme cytochrome c family protein
MKKKCAAVLPDRSGQLIMSTRKLPCPACAATLQIAASLAPGKKIRCPKCSEVFIPSTEDEDSPQRTAIRSRKRIVPVDEDEAEEERPASRKKQRKPVKKPASPLPWLIAGAVLLLGVGVALAIVFWPAKKTEPVAASNIPPPNPGFPGPGVGTGPGPGGNGVPRQPATGQGVFQTYCARCHQTSPTGRGRGPNLAKVGADPSHTVEWFTAFIRNPRSVKPNIRMPAFEGRIQPNDLKLLAEYLTTLK